MCEFLPERATICITNRQLLTGTAEYSPEVQTQILCRLSLIAEQHLTDAVILREKDLTLFQYTDLAGKVATLCREKNLPLILHHFRHVAESFEPTLPLHLSMSDFLAYQQQSPAHCNIVGVSTHTVEEAILAERLGAAYITASHIFPTACKEGLEPRGLDYLREVCHSVSIPVFALGGVHPQQIDSCITAGARGVCMMSEYFRADFVG